MYISFLNACPTFPAFTGCRRGPGLREGRAVLCTPLCPSALGTGCPVPSLLQTTSPLASSPALAPPTPLQGAGSGAFKLLHSLPKTALEKPITSSIRARNEFYQGYGVFTDQIRLFEGVRTVLSKVEFNQSMVGQSSRHHQLHE